MTNSFKKPSYDTLENRILKRSSLTIVISQDIENVIVESCCLRLNELNMLRQLPSIIWSRSLLPSLLTTLLNFKDFRNSCRHLFHRISLPPLSKK